MNLPMYIRKVLVIVAVLAAGLSAGVGVWFVTSVVRRDTVVAARVNGDVISWLQVDSEVSRAVPQLGIGQTRKEFEKQRAEIASAVIEQLVAQQLIMQEARKRNRAPSEEEIHEQVAIVKRHFPSESDFNNELARNGLTMIALRDLIKVQLSRRRLAESMAQGTVAEDEVRKQFEENRSIYEGLTDRRRVLHFNVTP